MKINGNGLKNFKFLSNGLVTLIVLAALFAAPAYAAIGDLFASGITSPGGMVKMGADVWVSDHVQGFCRLDVNPATGVATITASTCAAGPTSPGQPTFNDNFVYIPDNAATAARGGGVWRFTFDPVGRTVSSAVLIANMTVLGIDKPTATAFGADNKLYVGFIRGGAIKRITNPEGAQGTQVVETVGTTPGGGVTAFTFAGNDLYIADDAAVTKITAPKDIIAPGGAVASTVTLSKPVSAPTAIASSGANTLFIADTPALSSTVLRHTITTGVTEFYAFSGNLAGTLTTFQAVTGLAVDGTTVYIGDDPFQGGPPAAQGHIWKNLTTAPAEVAPPAPVALRNATIYIPVPPGATAPPGLVWLGSNLWVSDHLNGFCRANAQPGGTFACGAVGAFPPNGPTSPGQPAFDGNKFVYVPDNAAGSTDVWRLTFNSTTNTMEAAVKLAPVSTGDIRPAAAALAGLTAIYTSGL